MHRTQRMMRVIAPLAALALFAAACGDNGVDVGDDDNGNGEENGTIAGSYDFSGESYTVGSKDFTEQLILGQIALLALEAAGADTTDETDLGGTVANREALLAGEIDMYWDYDGTGWIEFLGETDIGDTETLPERVAEQDLEENGIYWVQPFAPFNNTYALAQSQEVADEYGVTTLTEFGELIESDPDAATLCIESEFESRDDGLPGLEEHYGFEVPDENIAVLDIGPIYQATADQDPCNFGEVFASDGRNAAFDLEILEDDQEFFPPYLPTITMQEETYEGNPELEDMFSEINQELDLDTMQELNERVDVDGEFPDEVAEDWLTENGFL
jgi:osmoprotectant transport system substrate-binding protein